MTDENVIYLDNDKVFQKDVETPNDAGEYAPATGLAGLTVTVSLTKGGAGLTSLTDLPMTERTGQPGRYFAIGDGAVFRTQLAGQVDKTVFVRYQLPGDLRVWEEYTVREFRS